MSERFEKHRQPWRSDEVAKLKTLASKGKGLKEIAKALNRTEESTKERAKIDGVAIAKKRCPPRGHVEAVSHRSRCHGRRVREER